MAASIPFFFLASSAVAGGLAAAPMFQAGSMAEYEIKARTLIVIGSYVTWPRPADGAAAQRPFVVGVLGNSPFEGHLDGLAATKTIRNRPIRMVYIRRFREAAIDGCDILFICGSEADQLSKILAYCKGKTIFTVADSPGFAQNGVMLNLAIVSKALSLEINLKAVKEAGFEISSSFLSLAKDKTKIVETP